MPIEKEHISLPSFSFCDTGRSDEIKRGKGKDLFLYIAKSVDHFIKQKSRTTTDEELLLGFTFSFVSGSIKKRKWNVFFSFLLLLKSHSFLWDSRWSRLQSIVEH